MGANGTTVRKAAPAAAFQEIGRTGLRRQGGYVTEEFLRELQGARGRKVYREMAQNDPVVGAILYAIEMLARQVSWRVEPAAGDPDGAARAAFVEDALLRDMSATWQDTLSEVLTMLPFGWSWLEIVYKRRGGESRDPTQRSRFADGRIGWRKWAIRGQETLLRWEFDPEGGVQALVQQDFSTGGQSYVIPVEKSLLFRTSTRKGNPEGTSCLRTSYRPWYFMRRIEEIEAVGVERDLAGYPVIQVAEGGPDIWNTKDAEATALKTVIETLIRNIKRDEQEGLLLPWWCDFKLVTTGSRRNFDTTGILQRYAQRIATATLCDFILLGHEKVGSFALASSKTHLFATALGAFLDAVAEVVNRHAVPRLLALNGWPAADAPRLVHGDIETPDLQELGAYVTQLAGAGMPLFPDEALERALRSAAKLPEPAQELSGGAPASRVPEGGGAEPPEDQDAALREPELAKARAVVHRLVERRRRWAGVKGRGVKLTQDAEAAVEDRRLFVEAVERLRDRVAALVG